MDHTTVVAPPPSIAQTIVPMAPAPSPRLIVRKDKTNPRRLAYLLLLLFAAPPAWPLLALGAALVAAGVLFHGWAAGYLARAGYVERRDEPELTVRGPYRHNRNPYYVAHLVMDLGFFCAAGLLPLFPLYVLVIFSVYRRWVLSEEPFLEAEFGDAYRAFKAEVPRWWVRLTPATARGPEQRFSWTLYLRNREAGRTGAHVLLLAALLLFATHGNPLATIDPWVRGTLVAVVGTWLCLHDVVIVDATRPSARWTAGWSCVAILLAAGAAALLLRTDPWQRWPLAASWLGVGVGLGLGLFVALSATLLPRATSKTSETLFARRTDAGLLPRPLLPLYLAALGLALVSSTLGGLWLASGLALVAWVLAIAGVLRLPTLRGVVPALLLLVLFAGAGALTISRLLG